MKSAVLVIDVQRGLFDVDPKPFERDLVLDRINSIIAKAHASDTQVVFIQHENPSGFLEYETENWRLQASLHIRNNDLKLRKTTPDAFLQTRLEEHLRAADVRNLVICGYASEFCVDSTTRRAAALGYSVQLVADAHTTHDKPHLTALQIREHHNATLPNLTSFSQRITAVTAAEIEFWR